MNLIYKITKKNILFFGGGEFGLGKTRTVEIFDILLKVSNNFQIIAISGKNKKMKLKFEELVNNNNCKDRVKVLKYTNQVPELMSICDLVITKPGGMTATESLASKLPMVVINPIPGQEEENAKFLEDNGVCIWIKKDDNPFKILNELLKNPNKLAKMKKNSSFLGNPNSTQNICDILLKK